MAGRVLPRAGSMTELSLAVPPEVFDVLVERTVETVLSTLDADQGARGWPEWMPVEVAAAYLGQTVAATRKLYERRKVPHYQDGHGAKVWLRRSELDAYMEACRRGPR